MSEFHLPYHFIPATGEINGKPSARHPWEDIAAGKAGPIRHDYWQADALHGRVVCKLTLQTPTVVGGMQTGPENAKVVQPYTVNGSPAIPGSSLRGMIGSVMETLSQSAMRVLGDGELSIQIDKKKQRVGSVHDFFRKINADLLPWNTERTHLSPAEALMGAVVDKNKEYDIKSGQKLCDQKNLASRIQFSDGLSPDASQIQYADGIRSWEVNNTHPVITLKILDSPKPPCPTLYFTPKNNNHELPFSLQSYAPRGRKYYLHHPLAQTEKEAWKSKNRDNLKQKLNVTPLVSGQSFLFHIDFQNLSKNELDLLLGSLILPVIKKPKTGIKAYYRHHLGLGKSLGMGSVEITNFGLYMIDRINRYTVESFTQPRYSSVYDKPVLNDHDYKAMQSLYPTELAALEQASCGKWKLERNLVDEETMQLLCTIGSLGFLKKDTLVNYPLTQEQYLLLKDELELCSSESLISGRKTSEKNGYKWFKEYKTSQNPKPLDDLKKFGELPTLDCDNS